MKISGVMPLRNAVKLGYPFELAIRSLRPLCDEVVVLVDPTSEDDTLARVRALTPDVIVESAWDTENHAGHVNCEITIQTRKAIAATTGDWIFSLQADEMLHESEIDQIRWEIEEADRHGITGIEFLRIYFYRTLTQVRVDWSIWMVRLFMQDRWKPDVDGAMRFDPCAANERRMPSAAKIYHYSRVGDPHLIAERVRNLDRFFHAPETVQSGDLPTYDFSTLRRLDTYVIDAPTEIAENALLIPFPVERHPHAVQEHFRP